MEQQLSKQFPATVPWPQIPKGDGSLRKVGFIQAAEAPDSHDRRVFKITSHHFHHRPHPRPHHSGLDSHDEAHSLRTRWHHTFRNCSRADHSRNATNQYPSTHSAWSFLLRSIHGNETWKNPDIRYKEQKTWRAQVQHSSGTTSRSSPHTPRHHPRWRSNRDICRNRSHPAGNIIDGDEEWVIRAPITYLNGYIFMSI